MNTTIEFGHHAEGMQDPEEDLPSDSFHLFQMDNQEIVAPIEQFLKSSVKRLVL